MKVNHYLRHLRRYNIEIVELAFANEELNLLLNKILWKRGYVAFTRF
jgi:hypothetical protein